MHSSIRNFDLSNLWEDALKSPVEGFYADKVSVNQFLSESSVADKINDFSSVVKSIQHA